MKKISIKKKFKSLGTDVCIELVIDSINDKEKALEDVKNVIRIYKEKEKTLSRFNGGSELSMLNSSLGKFIKCSNDIVYLSEKSLKYNNETDGLFDPRILETLRNIGYREDFKKNIFKKEKALREIEKELEDDMKVKKNQVMFKKEMDFSGIAKGYITDQVSDFLKKEGWSNFLVDSGGDIFASGLNNEGEKWVIYVEVPGSRDRFLKIISNEAIATSGVTRRNWEIDKEKFHHIINPKKISNFDFGVQSVSVVSWSAEDADVWAKTLFLMGIKEGLKFSNRNRIKSAFLLNNDKLIFSDNFK